MADRYPEPGGEAPPAAVVFDLFNTLTAPVDDSEFRSSLMEMALAVGADPDAFTQGWLDLWRERFSGVFPTVEASVRGVCDAIGLRVSETTISGAVRLCSEFSRRTLRPRPEALPTLARLRSLGLGTALISDCSPDVPVLWPTTPFAQAIDHPLFSCVEGLTKPDPSIYLRACQRLGVDPGGLRVRGRRRQPRAQRRQAGRNAGHPHQAAQRDLRLAQVGIRHVAGRSDSGPQRASASYHRRRGIAAAD